MNHLTNLIFVIAFLGYVSPHYFYTVYTESGSARLQNAYMTQNHKFVCEFVEKGRIYNSFACFVYIRFKKISLKQHWLY
jgi:hypothetical protein